MKTLTKEELIEKIDELVNSADKVYETVPVILDLISQNNFKTSYTDDELDEALGSCSSYSDVIRDIELDLEGEQ